MTNPPPTPASSGRGARNAAHDLAAHIIEPLSDRAFRTMALLETRGEKAQVATSVASQVAGWAAGVICGLLAPDEKPPTGPELLRWVADQIDAIPTPPGDTDHA